jgi:4-amino-4-deoxy-L-arabinose transferase-like glycosyltransferase
MTGLTPPRASRPRFGALLLALLIVATLVAGMIYAAGLGAGLRYLDEQDYVAIARHLVAGQGYTIDGVTPTAYRAPGYPLVLAALIALGLDVVGLRVANFVLLSGTLWLLYRLLRREGVRLAALIAPVLLLGYPVIFYTAGTLYPQTLALALLLLALLLATDRAHPWRGAILGGLAFGYAILVVPTFALKLPFFALATVLYRQRGWAGWRTIGRALGPAVLLCAVTLALLIPWTARNAVALHSFVPLTTNSGYNFLLGNSENTRPNAGVNIDISRYEQAAAPLSEVARDAYFRDAARDWVLAHPGRALILYAEKALNYFNYRNDLYVATESSRRNDLLLLLTYGPLLLLFVLRLLLARRMPLSALEWLCVGLYLVNPFLDALATTRIRYRLPFDALLIVVAAVCLELLWHRYREMGRRTENPVVRTP